MAFISDTIGDPDDRIRLVFATEEIVIAESWDVHESVIVQPAVFSVTCGSGQTSADLLKRFPPGTSCQLFVGGHLQFTGTLDKRGATQPPGGGTTLHFGGRDMLGALESSDVKLELSITDPTYPRIVWKALQQVGLAPPDVPEPDPTILFYSNDANRQIKAGTKVRVTVPIVTVPDFLAGRPGQGGGVVQVRSKLAEKWHRFCRRYLDRAGLFLWATADGRFVLSAPNAGQKPLYEIIRRRQKDKSNVVGMDWDDDTTHRHSDFTIYGRGGGRKSGRSKIRGASIDDEMGILYGLDRPGCAHDAVVQSGAEAADLATRRLAEERRSSWRLSYTISGHTLPLLGGNGERAIVTPDTVVRVDDEELGIQEDLYIETVRRRRNPGTQTEVHLMRPQDLIFTGGGEQE